MLCAVIWVAKVVGGEYERWRAVFKENALLLTYCRFVYTVVEVVEGKTPEARIADMNVEGYRG